MAASAETVTALPPLFVIVSDRDLLVPVVTFPKLRDVEATEIAPGVTPVPESATLALPVLEVMLTLPLAAPVAVGANETEKLADCPAFSVTGRARPVTLYPAPVAETADTVTAVPPLLVIVSDIV